MVVHVTTGVWLHACMHIWEMSWELVIFSHYTSNTHLWWQQCSQRFLVHSQITQKFFTRDSGLSGLRNKVLILC